uniref:Uncharacterized protein n=1 Tax=Chromera velia CCMP2878 TaxID=1169474 RepID=A0A0G4F1Z1_9ALVE|mmetsp:Transcript_56188/g.110031  ORF Transcript_56188/g.110031 Transcript_56188/m.110031 type:complete len:204 (-) Transcript_56188:78-689(-)|eukprot:Cvel_14728.t1-p1 / transcript=Cvel_14728.t1 / gene=Cvel_14728 / organism=Chromera_velia_CCMP2878 / gene_product=hypothetical protein / transcript_product=hypothetical protein / location=Cvel_scaffold1059:28382-30467(-) / protein_length=203 / sequence_SO=supercontig / SO=protein_coding / is_pseudo=false
MPKRAGTEVQKGMGKGQEAKKNGGEKAKTKAVKKPKQKLPKAQQAKDAPTIPKIQPVGLQFFQNRPIDTLPEGKESSAQKKSAKKDTEKPGEGEGDPQVRVGDVTHERLWHDPKNRQIMRTLEERVSKQKDVLKAYKDRVQTSKKQQVVFQSLRDTRGSSAGEGKGELKGKKTHGGSSSSFLDRTLGGRPRQSALQLARQGHR